MKTIRDFNVKNKRVLIRCDFNVPLDKRGNILNDFRIRVALPTIKYLMKQGAKIILMSHLGRPEGKRVESLKLDPIQEKLLEYLDVSITKAPGCIGKEIEQWVGEMKSGEILLLENLRFYKGEKANDENFAKSLASLADIYINDAFGVCHREHASVVGVPKYLPSAAGFLLAKEIKVLSDVLKRPKRPLVAIIGGVKIETKIKAISFFLEKADHLLFGGTIANSVLGAKGISINIPELNEQTRKEVEKLDLTSSKLHLPVDVIVCLNEKGEGLRQSAIAGIKKEEMVLDVGPETIDIFSEIIEQAKMIIWNGPLGMFENKKFEKGTKKIALAIAKNEKAFKIAGGGETVEAINKFGLIDKFDHISTGGGAMLAFLSGEKLPGIEALK